MLDAFKIYIDRLAEGTPESISGSFPPALLEIEEKELQFHRPLEVVGEVYGTEDHLVLHFRAKTVGQMPCAVCNQPVEFLLQTEDFTHTLPFAEIEGKIFDAAAVIREALLLELPRTAECSGACPERKRLAGYLKNQAQSDTYHPFSNL
jgi:uncharacterized metal-binding protein YceD (DUF177 family)